MSNWTGLDFLIFFIFVLNTLLGMARGATKEIISILCLSAALIFTIKFTIPLSAFINSSPLIQDVIASPMMQNFMLAIGLGQLTQAMLFTLGYCISLLICFVGIFCACEAVLSYSGVIGIFSFPYVAMDRKIGAALGCVRGYVITLVFILIYLFLSPNMTHSYFLSMFENSAKKLNTLITQQAPERYNEVLRDKDLYNSKMVIDTLKQPPR